MDFGFYMPARVLVGDGVVRENAALLGQLGSRCLLVTGKNSARLSGALDDVAAALDHQGIPWQVFDGIGQNPLLSSCHAAGLAAREFGADFLVGIGGGGPPGAPKPRLSMPPTRSLPPGRSTVGTKSPPCPLPWWGPPPAPAARSPRYRCLPTTRPGGKRG